MKAISLWQPWAYLVVTGAKKIETRSWKTNYRGPLAIHAALYFPPIAKDFAREERALRRVPEKLPFGAIIGMVTLYDVVPTIEIEASIPALERYYGNYAPWRWAWLLKDAIAFDKPMWFSGRQGLFNVPDELLPLAVGIEQSAKRKAFETPHPMRHAI